MKTLVYILPLLISLTATAGNTYVSHCTSGSSCDAASFTWSTATSDGGCTSCVSTDTYIILSGYTVTASSLPTTNAILTIQNNASATFSSNWDIAKNVTININNGGTLSVIGNMTMTSSYDAANPIILNGNGTLHINGNLSQNAGSFSTINNNATGKINVTGSYSDDQNTVFTNAGIVNITNGNFTLNQQGTFTNNDGGDVTIDNSATSGKAVTFNNLDFANNIKLNAGSKFNVIKTNVTSSGYGTMTIAGKFYLQDGNYSNSGVTIAITTGGGFFTKDTDNSGDGILSVTGGGSGITNSGSLYIEGITFSGGGYAITDNGTMFIRDINDYGGGGSTITVTSGGVLTYCGNLTPGADGFGNINASGTLNYVTESYPNTNPGAQADFNVSGTEVPMYTTKAECMSSYSSVLSNALPIELSYFNVIQNGKTIAIEWTTESETNNDFFTILKAIDNSIFDSLDYIKGNGTTTECHNYQFADENPQMGMNYYKLQQTDIDGKSTVSEVKSVFYKPDKIQFMVSQNPVKASNARLTFYDISENSTIEVTDANGIVICKINCNDATPILSIQLSEYCTLKQGVYYITLINALGIKTQEILIE